MPLFTIQSQPQLSQYFIRPLPVLAFIGFTTVSHVSTANSLFVGYGQSEQVTEPSEGRRIDFTPGGKTALLSVDLTEQLSFSADVYRADQSKGVSDRLNGDIAIRSWSVGAGYFVGSWSFYANYTDWHDELSVSDSNSAVVGLKQESESPSYSLQLGYDWQQGNWQWGAGMGLHYSDWTQFERRQPRNEPARTSTDKGSSTFVSVDLSTSYYVQLHNNRALIMGISGRWNQLTNSESQAVSRNGRNISQINSPRITNLINAQSALGTESYGQINTYLSVDIAENWLVDVNYSMDFAGEENSSAWAVNLGYLF